MSRVDRLIHCRRLEVIECSYLKAHIHLFVHSIVRYPLMICVYNIQYTWIYKCRHNQACIPCDLTIDNPLVKLQLVDLIGQLSRYLKFDIVQAISIQIVLHQTTQLTFNTLIQTTCIASTCLYKCSSLGKLIYSSVTSCTWVFNACNKIHFRRTGSHRQYKKVKGNFLTFIF